MEEIKLNSTQKKLLERYFDLIKQFNSILNLISRNEIDFFWEKQIMDSLQLINFIKFQKGEKVIDLGSGGGVPGIPLAIMYPETDFLLVDSVAKKVDALNKIISNLQLKNVKAISGRIEDLAHKEAFREKYDYVTAKALAPMNILLEYAMPFLKVGGSLIAYKGLNYNNEIEDSKNALNLLKSNIKDIKEYTLNNDLGSRTLIFVEKLAKTDNIFPRKVGIPSKKPL